MICSICLDGVQNPFATPCGHVFCLECLVSASQKSPDAMTAPCPTCRTTFSLVSPDPAFVPEKYRPFIDSNLRRIYLDNSLEIALQEKVAQLESRVKSLEKDKSLLMARCESHMAAATSHARREKDARMQCATLQNELKEANLCFAQLVEKETRKKIASSPAGNAPCSRPSFRANTSPPSPFKPRDGGPGTLGKRGFNTASEHGSSTKVLDESHSAVPYRCATTVPLPKRRRVSVPVGKSKLGL